MDEATKLPIGPEEVAEAAQILQRYKAGKAALDKRLVDNELWFRMGHWKNYQNPMMEGKPQPSSGWLFNSIANKHADAMDNYPSPNVLPRAEDDEAAAQALSSVLPVVLEQADYEQVYSDTWWRKLKQGTGVKGVFWDSEQRGGVGEIAIRPMNLLMLYWEPGVDDIQASPHFFSLSLADTAQLESRWPQLAGHTASVLDVPHYIHDGGLDTSDKSVVVDWYYKKLSPEGRSVLHYCKFCNGVVLYASENDPALAERGFYDHGKYPFVFDALFMEEDSPAGFGYIDVMKECQTAIDKMNHAMDENVLLSSRQRYVLSDTAGVNEEELTDLSRDIIHVVGRLNDDSFRPLQTAGLQGNSLSYRNSRIEELKEISGNRDMTQGGTAGGVTAASAIAALQEAGSKLSRDMLKSAYRAFAKECCLIIELMRQFYDEERIFRITGKSGESEFVRFSGQVLRAQPARVVGGVELGSHEPVFDIVVSAEKKSTFSRLSQNETAKECYQLGFFAPANADAALAALEMMDFEGIEKVRQRVRQNGTLAQQLARMQAQMAQLTGLLEVQKKSEAPKLSGPAQELSTAAMARAINYTELDGPAGPTCRLEASGHAGYAPAGQDIVCAGASTLMQTLCALLAGEEGTRSGVWDEPDGPRLAVTAAAPQKPWVEGAFEFAKAGFALLAERYPDNVRFADLSGRGEQSMVDLQMFAEGDAAAPSAPALSHAQAQQAIASGTMKADEGREASDVPTPAAVQEPEERPAPPERPAPLPPIPGLREGANTVRALHARWAAEEAMLRRDMPDFSLKQELANPEMRRLMELPGMRMGDAYRLAHYNDALRQTAQTVEQGVVERIRQRSARPAENGTSPGGAAITRADVASMTRAQREALERRAMHGVKISF